MAHDVGRQQRQLDRIVGARDAVLHLHQRVERQRHAGDREREDDVARKPRLEQLDRAHAERRDDAGAADREPAAAREIAAQQIERPALGVFRHEALRRRRQAEVGKVADQQHPGPDVDIDAELEASHPAREQDLRCIDQRGADDADEESSARHLLRNRAVAAVGEPGAQMRGQARQRNTLQTIRILGLGQRHKTSPRPPLPAGA